MMDNKGNITLEIGIVLIVIVMIFGAVLSINEMNTNKLVRTIENEHDETLIEEVADYLINNPGNASYGKKWPCDCK